MYENYVHIWILHQISFQKIYRVYQKEVNSLKTDSKLKSMRHLVKILFYLDKLVSCLPPVAKSLVCDSQLEAQWLFL